MDSLLQNLRRRFALGDESVQLQIEALECRLGDHQYRRVTWDAPRWIRVEVCERCLYAKGLRPEDVADPPTIFALNLNPGSVFHAVGVFANNYSWAIVLCGGSGSRHPPRPNHLRDCRNPISCKKCLQIIERDAPRQYSANNVFSQLTPLKEILAETSRLYYQHLIDLYPGSAIAASELNGQPTT